MSVSTILHTVCKNASAEKIFKDWCISHDELTGSLNSPASVAKQVLQEDGSVWLFDVELGLFEVLSFECLLGADKNVLVLCS